MKMEVNLSCKVMLNKIPMLIQLRDCEVRKTSHPPIQAETQNLSLSYLSVGEKNKQTNIQIFF